MKNKENIGNIIAAFLVIAGFVCMIIPLLYKIYEWFGWSLFTFVIGIICIIIGVMIHCIIEDQI